MPKRPSLRFSPLGLAVLGQLTAERPAATRIFLWITGLMDDQNALATSQPVMAEALAIHRNTVTEAIAYLKEKQVLAVFREGSQTLYALNCNLVCQYGARATAGLFTAEIAVGKPAA